MSAANLRAAVEIVERADDLRHARVGEAIVNRLRFTPGFHELAPAKSRQMLRQSRLTEANNLLEFADGTLAIQKFAKNHQPPVIGQKFQKASCFAGLNLHRLYIHCC